MRSELSRQLVRLATMDKRIVLLTGDHGYELFDVFRKSFPNQYINVGIAEQNMIGVAAGMCRFGFKPIVYGLSAFVPVRTVEQIKIDVAYDKLPVIILGDGAGFVYSHLGTSHQSTEDIACVRAIPNMSIFSPADRHEMAHVMDQAYRLEAPAYIRIGKADLGDVHSPQSQNYFNGSFTKILEGSTDLPGIIATGSMVKTAIQIGSEFNLQVWSAPVIKPLDIAQLREIVTFTDGLAVLEEHSIYGGLGSAVAEIVAENFACTVVRCGVLDRFSEKCGSYQYLLEEHSLDYNAIKCKISSSFNLSN